MYLHFVVLGVLALCIMVGFYYRISAVLFFLTFAYIFLIDVALYLNHFYLIILVSFLLIFIPANRGFSMDAKLHPEIRSTPLESAIPAIRLDAIQGFLVQNRIVSPKQLDLAPYLVQGESERLVLGAGDRFYVRGVLPDAESFNVVRRGPLYVDPETDEALYRENGRGLFILKQYMDTLEYFDEGRTAFLFKSNS